MKIATRVSSMSTLVVRCADTAIPTSGVGSVSTSGVEDHVLTCHPEVGGGMSFRIPAQSRRIVASLSEVRPAHLAADRKLTDRCLDPVNARCRAVQWCKAARSFGNGGPVARQLLLALAGMSVIR